MKSMCIVSWWSTLFDVGIFPQVPDNRGREGRVGGCG